MSPTKIGRARKAFLVLGIAAIGSLGVAACGDDDSSTSASTGPDTAASMGAGDASVSFITPKKDATTGRTVTAKVDLAGFELDPKDVGKAADPGHGHLHFSMDDGRFDYPKYSGANGELATKLGVEGKYSPSVEPQITYSNLPPGKHTLVVDLANNDHTATGVSTSTTFTVG